MPAAESAAGPARGAARRGGVASLCTPTVSTVRSYSTIAAPSSRTRPSESCGRSAPSLHPPRQTPVAGRPISNLSFAINYAAGGLDVTGYHVWNIGVHILAALALLGTLRMTGPWAAPDADRTTSDRLALVCTLVWVLHPLNSEAVNYLTQRTESMVGLFYLLTMYAAITAHRCGSAPSMGAGRHRLQFLWNRDERVDGHRSAHGAALGSRLRVRARSSTPSANAAVSTSPSLPAGSCSGSSRSKHHSSVTPDSGRESLHGCTCSIRRPSSSGTFG